MARARNPNVDTAEKMYLKGEKLKDIAAALELPEGTIRRWKSTYGWGKDNERSKQKANVRKEKPIPIEVKSVMKNPDLNDKQRLFCLYYSRSFNATRSYQKAYECSYSTAMAEGCKSLKNPKIKNEIIQLKEERYSQAILKPEDIFQKYMDIAFSDITDYLEFGREEVQVMSAFGPVYEKDEESGENIPVTKILNTVRFRESHEVDGSIISEVKQGKDGASIKLADRMKALDWLADHMDMATAEQSARIEKLKAETIRITGEDAEIEDLTEMDADIYGEE